MKGKFPANILLNATNWVFLGFIVFTSYKFEIFLSHNNKCEVD